MNFSNDSSETTLTVLVIVYLTTIYYFFSNLKNKQLLLLSITYLILCLTSISALLILRISIPIRLLFHFDFSSLILYLHSELSGDLSSNILYLLGTVFFPGYFLIRVYLAPKHDSNGISLKTIEIFKSLVHGSITTKQILYLVSLSAEFSDLKVSLCDMLELNKIKHKSALYPSERFTSPQMTKAICLLIAHTEKMILPEDLQTIQKEIVIVTLKLIKSLIAVTCSINFQAENKKISPNTFEIILDFYRSLVLRVPFESPVNEIFPEIKDKKEIKICLTVKEMQDYLQNNSDLVTPQELEKIKCRIEGLPRFKAFGSIKSSQATKKFEEIHVEVQICKMIPKSFESDHWGLLNLSTDFEENYWVIIGYKGHTLAVNNYNSKDPHTSKLSFHIKSEILCTDEPIEVYVRSDFYIGLDNSISIKLGN